MAAVVSWSGGKDCCLALHRARANGIKVTALFTMLDETRLRTRSHGVPLDVMQAQAVALGLPLVTAAASWDAYEHAFICALKELQRNGITDAVFGDIDIDPHREWEERICAAAIMTAHLPLWGHRRDALAEEIISLGYKALVVCADDRWLGAEVCGRAYDKAFLAALPPGVDPCGENGEFHTFVADGPPFSHPVPVEIRSTETRERSVGVCGCCYHFARLALRECTGRLAVLSPP